MNVNFNCFTVYYVNIKGYNNYRCYLPHEHIYSVMLKT